ncbi:hypothetical protein ACXR0M_27245, partial [Pseudomonas sp. Eth.TT006]
CAGLFASKPAPTGLKYLSKNGSASQIQNAGVMFNRKMAEHRIANVGVGLLTNASDQTTRY